MRTKPRISRPRRVCDECGRLTSVSGNGKLHAHTCKPGVEPSNRWSEAATRRQAIIDRYRAAPDDAKPTMQSMGDEWGITRGRVRQILAENGIHVRRMKREHNAVMSVERLRARLLKAMQAALERPPCVVCGAWIIRSFRDVKTCSEECSDVYTQTRFTIDADAHHRHRVQTAESILRYPEKHKPSRIDWANRMLGPNPPPPNRRYSIIHKDLFAKMQARTDA